MISNITDKNVQLSFKIYFRYLSISDSLGEYLVYNQWFTHYIVLKNKLFSVNF